MGKVGRKPAIEKSKQIDVFKNYAHKLLNVKYGDPIFKQIASDLGNLMTPAALYISWKRNSKEVLKNAPQQQSEPKTPSPCSSPSSSEKSTSSCHEITNVIVESNNLMKTSKGTNFKFELDIYDWKKLQPLSAFYRRNDLRSCAPFKKYRILPKYKWVDILRRKIWYISKLPCTWMFKQFKVISESHIIIKGQCSQCNAFTHITCEQITDKIVVGQCQITLDDEVKSHDPNKKYRLNPLVRRKIAKKLKFESASSIQKQLSAETSTQECTQTAPIVPTLNALRKIKHEERKRLWLHKNVILSINMMAVSIKQFIREIKTFPKFHIYYWTDLQEQYCREYISNFRHLTISLDATGSIFQPLKLPNHYELSKRLFLYVVMLVNKLDVSVPICQLITDSHDTVSIFEWLSQWIKQVGCYPNEVITDDSSALVAANVKTFTEFTSVKDYLFCCYNILNSNKVELPKAFIRLDTSHFIKTLYHFKCFENINDNIKKYYIRCIRFLKICQDFTIIKDTISKIIKLCLCQNDFESGVREIKQSLDYFLNSKKIDEFEINEQNCDSEHDEIIFDDSDFTDFVLWFDTLVENEKITNSKNYNETDKVNPYYLPTFIPTLKRLYIKLPLWGNVMCPYFKCNNLNPSSSSVESYFRILKQLVLKSKLSRLRVDEYLHKHYDYLRGELHLGLNKLKDIGSKYIKDGTTLLSKQKTAKRGISKRKNSINLRQRTKQKQCNTIFSNDSIFSDIPSYSENWRGEININKRLGKDEEIVFIRNGNLTKYTSGYLNTCALDSAFHLIGRACKNSSVFKTFLEKLETDDVINYIFMLINGSENVQLIYNGREKIAKTFFVNNDCSCNVAYIFEKIFLNYFTSAQLLKSCKNCTIKRTQRDYVFITINIDILKLFGLSSLEEAIFFIDEPTGINCESCFTQLHSEFKFGEIITFDLNGAAEAVLLSELPITINIKDHFYRIVGAIEFITGATLGHYKCHFFSNNNYYCYDDNAVKIEISTSKKICLHAISYTKTT